MSEAIQKAEQTKYLSVKAALEASKGAMAEVIPKHLDAERLLNLSLLSVRKTPALLDCPVSTLLGCVVEASRLGLEIGGSLGHAYLVPFKDKGQPTCQMMLGYRGFVELMRRGGKISTIRAVVVHEKDEFSVTEGIDFTIVHKPCLADDPGPMTHVYAVAKFAGTGDYQAVWMTKAAVDKIRARSRAGASGPWVTDYEEMAKKTAVRRLAKLSPLTVEAMEAIDADDSKSFDVESTATEVASEVTQPPSAKEKLAAKRKLVIQEPPAPQMEAGNVVEPPDDVVLPTLEGQS